MQVSLTWRLDTGDLHIPHFMRDYVMQALPLFAWTGVNLCVWCRLQSNTGFL
jgi:hypothetical protein